MAGTSGMLTSLVVSMLESTSSGVNVRIAAMQQADSSIQVPGVRTIIAFNTSIDTTEKTGHAQYPALLVYCDKLSNSLKEKFRQFSGKARITVEARYSQDVLSGLEVNTEIYVDSVCALLDNSRGDWGSGFFYSGGYDVSFEPVVRGGKNFLQRAKVAFDVEVSK